ncbi:AAA-like domain-containing protein [Sorangium sp. So ce134]
MRLMPSIRWLHLTDLHVGMKGMGPLWPSLEDEFRRDLALVHRQAGPFDVVLFSGDLVQSGTRDQFDKLTEALQQLWAHLAELGSTPVLLAVPGNHDLQRPNERSPEVRALINWSHDQDLRGTLFWHEADGKPYRHVVDTAFAEYTRWTRSWHAEHPPPAWLTVRDAGLLPGEFAASIRKDGLSLGVVGLNSAFLHLSGSIQRGQIALHPDQLHAICNGSPSAWTGQHHACLLMTHHPPEWLTPDALAFYQGSILLPQWFIGHVYGHMHEPQAVVQSVGGAPAQRHFQGASLFGLETWNDAQGSHVTRLHGYSAGRIDLDAERRGTLRVWPRIARRQAGTGLWRLVPDYERFDLDEQNSFSIDLGVRPRAAQPAQHGGAPQSRPSVALASPGQVAMPEPPGLGYSEAWYVPHASKEQLAVDTLRHPAAPVILAAPPMSGKSTVMRRIIGLLRKEDRAAGGHRLVLHVDLGLLTDRALDDPPTCFREMALLLVDAYGKTLQEGGHEALSTADWVDLAWQRPGAPERRLTLLLERRILAAPLSPQRVVVAIDRMERVIGRPAGNPVARMLRQWVDNREDGRWAPVRLLLAAAGFSLYFRTPDAVSELFAAALHIRIDNFRIEQLHHLARLYGGRWDDQELQRLFELTNGQPYLSRLILFLEATGTRKDELLDLERLKLEHCASALRQMWLVVSEREELRKPLCAVLRDPAVKLSADEYARLYQTGLVHRTDSGYDVPNVLVASYFRERC